MTDIHFRQVIDNSRLVRVSDPARRREQQVFIAVMACLFLLGFGYAWQNYQMVHLGYQIEEVRHKTAGLNEWNRALQLEQSSLRDPLRVYALAETRLGLESARPGQIVQLDAGVPGDRNSGAVMADLRPASESLPAAVDAGAAGAPTPR
ncbi:MAG: hypothetical protein ACYC6M_04690 [Terriglobales bacterium]